MASAVIVRSLPLDEIFLLRWQVLRPGLPREMACFAGDDMPETLHLGAFFGDSLAGVASMYLAALPEMPAEWPAWQVRGMAAAPEHRAKGAGRALVAECERAARAAGGLLVWCNARREAVGFYSKCGWGVLGAEFCIETVGPHFRMLKRL